jgi:hypothetical protein
MPSDFYDKAWESTFDKILVCGQDVSSAFTFVLAEHPQMMLSMGRMATPQSADCATSVIFSVPYMDRAAVLIGSNPLPKLKYILDFPVSGDQDSFGLRFHLRSAEIRALDQGTLPPWKSFAIDNPDEGLVLRIRRKGASWNSIPELDRNLPDKILLRAGLESGGPWVVREYQLTSRVPHQIERGGDGSQVFTWAFTWKRIGYAEQPNQFADVNGRLSTKMQFQDIRN